MRTPRRLPLAVSALLALVPLGCGDTDGAAPVASDAGAETAPDAETEADAPSDGDAPAPLCAPWPHDLRWGTTLDDDALAVAADPSGRPWVVGYERGIRIDALPTGDALGYALRFERDGTVDLRTELDTEGADALDAIAPYAGGWVFAGHTDGAFPGFTAAGQSDLVVGALSASGEITHLVQTGTERPEHPRRVVETNGRVLVAGYDDVYIPSNYVESWEDPLFASLAFDPSAPGGLRLDVLRKFGTPETDLARDVAADGEGAFVAGEASGAKPGSYLWKLDATGATAWALRLSAGGAEAAAAVVPTPGGDVYLVGSTMKLLGAKAYGDDDVFVARIDVGGAAPAVRWVAQAGSAGSDYAIGASLAPDGTLYVAGETTGALVEGAEGGAIAPFVIGFEANGAVLGAWQKPVADDVFVNGVAADPCGGFFVVGAANAGAPRRWEAFLAHGELAAMR